MIPVELVHGPRRDRRLDQGLHEDRVIAPPALLEPRCQCVACASELCQWEPEQSINIILELAPHFDLGISRLRLTDCMQPSTISYHSSSLSLFSQNQRKNLANLDIR